MLISANQLLNVNIVNNHTIPLLRKTTEDKEGTLANPKGSSGPREQASVNAVTASSVKTPGPTYSSTSRTKVSLQVFPVKIMSEEGHCYVTA